ncbi:MAG: OsmC family protein [Nitrospirae bacterium]|nr:OsmC family protein [Nitrospirota bacterium]
MSEQETFEESLKGYKEKVATLTKATLTWERDLIFTGRTQQGYEIEFDAHVQWGCKPTDALLLSLAGCMGIDVLMFLQKMKCKIDGFRMDIVGDRNPSPPQYFRTVEMVLHIAGKDIGDKKVDRAIRLSQEKYCSVFNSLRKDMDIKVKYIIEEKAIASDPTKEITD